MLAVVACIDPQLRPLVPKSLGEREIKLSLPPIPVVLKVRWVVAAVWGWRRPRWWCWWWLGAVGAAGGPAL